MQRRRQHYVQLGESDCADHHRLLPRLGNRIVTGGCGRDPSPYGRRPDVSVSRIAFNPSR
jgi:hypothetical protein